MDIKQDEYKNSLRGLERSPGFSDYTRLIYKSRESSEGDNIWLITLSDLLSLLLVFFVMFFALTRAQDKNQKTAVPGTEAAIISPISIIPTLNSRTERIMGDIGSVIRDLKMSEDVAVYATNKDVVINLDERVTFRSGGAEIIEDSFQILDNIARIIMKHQSLTVEIDGHTDNRPINTSIYPSNWELSVARAASVLKYFINRHDINPARFYIKGNADQRPAAPNDSLENRARNRRVEIRLKDSANL